MILINLTLCWALAGGHPVGGGQSAAMPEPKVVWQWQAKDGLAAWDCNADMADLEETADAVRFRTVGGDPIMTFRTHLNVPTTLWQAFEICMQADQPGTAELFWTETSEGPYGGFSQEKSARFAVAGGSEMRSYRVFPFWHNLGRILKLRFDPYGGARFSIAWMRIVQWPEPALVRPRLSLPAESALFRPLRNIAAKPTATGLRLEPTEPGGFALAPWTGQAADDGSCITLELTSSKPGNAALVFATDQASGLHDITFRVTGDGKRRVYNLEGMEHPSWRGRILALGLRTDAAVELHSLTTSERPAGPADLRIVTFDADQALPRTGRPVRLTARLLNVGGAVLRNGSVVFRLPRGCRRVGAKAAGDVRIALPALEYGEEHEVTLDVIAGEPGQYRIACTATAAGAAPSSASCTLRVTKPPAVRRTAAIPPPIPVRGKLDVGVYYFPGWRTSGQWAPITRFLERRPVLGWYREGDPSVADWHIKWAVEHGITFFAYDWYWSAGARSLEHALHEGLFNAKYRHMLKFCLLWANHNPPGTSSHEDFMAVVAYWIENYFKRPEYYTIDGKPVVIIFSPYRFRADMGSAAVKRSFEAMREECRKAGLPGLYLIACVGGDTSEHRVAAEEGYDAISAYNRPGLGLRENERIGPFADLLEPHRAHWERMADAGPLPIMTPVSGGWDSRPWHGDNAMVRSGRTPPLFRRHLEDARRFIESRPGKALPVALIEAWNEFGEGSYIEPHREYGFGFLDAVREVFTDAPREHTDLAPEDVGLSVPQVSVRLSPGAWDMAKEGEGWGSGMDVTEIRFDAEGMHALTAGRDPAFFGPPTQIRASRRKTLMVRMRLTPAQRAETTDTAQVFWSTRSVGTSEAASVRFPVHLDGQWHEYRVDLSGNPRWRGTIIGLRLDPCNQPGVRVSIAKIAVE